MVQALIDAYYALGTPHFLELAHKNASFIDSSLIKEHKIWHSYREGQPGVLGYLEDYAWVARAFISLYQATFEEPWLYKAEKLAIYAIKHYWDESTQLFYFTEENAPKLIIRSKEVFDQVIPSSNAVMAHNLFYLGTLLDNEAYMMMAKKMLVHINPVLNQATLHLSHWASLYIKQFNPMPTVAIIGPQYKTWSHAIKQKCPEVILTGAIQHSSLPLLADKKTSNNNSTIYICYGKTCQLPVDNLEQALIQLKDISRKINTLPSKIAILT